MNKLKAAAVLSVLFLSTGSPSFGESVYVPPVGERPRFGGEFGLTEVGPVAGYWHAECYNWHVRSQARRNGPLAPAELSAAFRRFVSGLIVEKPNYDDMSPAMADAVRRNLRTYWPSFNRMGRFSIAKQFDTDQDGNKLYVVDLAGGEAHWNAVVNPQGKIAAAFLCGGQGL